MTDVYISDDNPAKKIEQIMRTENTEAALKAFQSCLKDASTYGDDYKDQLNQLKKTLKDDGALDLLSLQWANDHKGDQFPGEKKITRDELTKIVGNIGLASGDTGSFNPDMNGNAMLANNLIPQIDIRNGLNVSDLDATETAQRNSFVGKGGGVQLNDLAIAAKKLLDDGPNGTKLFDILAMNSGHSDGRIEDGGLQRFVDKVNEPKSTYLKSLGYTPEQTADVMKAVKTIQDHYDDFATGWFGTSFNSTELAQNLGFAGAADMMSTFRQMDANDAAAKKPTEPASKPSMDAKDHPGTTAKPTSRRDPAKDPSKDPSKDSKDRHTAKGDDHSGAKSEIHASHEKLSPIPSVELGEGYYQVATRWLKEAHVDASEAQIEALTRSLVNANAHRTELRVGEILKFDPSDPAFTVMSKTSTPGS